MSSSFPEHPFAITLGTPAASHSGKPTCQKLDNDAYDDPHAMQLILALIHDCFIGFTQSKYNTPLARLISLYITSPDLKRFKCRLSATRLEVLRQLVGLRDEIFFEPHDEACKPPLFLRKCIETVCVEPVQEWDEEDNDGLQQNILGRIQTCLTRLGTTQAPGMIEVVELCNDIREALDLRPWSPFSLPIASNEELSRTEREVVLLYDIFNAFYAFVDEPGEMNPQSARPFISRDVHCREGDAQDIQSLIMVRDIMCGLLDGPSTLRWEGACETYLLPLLERREEWDVARSSAAEALMLSLDDVQLCFGDIYAYSQAEKLLCLRRLTSEREGGFGAWLPGMYEVV